MANRIVLKVVNGGGGSGDDGGNVGDGHDIVGGPV